jgi:hypothetical protein
VKADWQKLMPLKASRCCEEVGCGADYSLDRPKQEDELMDYERSCASGEALVYACMIRLMARRLARTRDVFIHSRKTISPKLNFRFTELSEVAPSLVIVHTLLRCTTRGGGVSPTPSKGSGCYNRTRRTSVPWTNWLEDWLAAVSRTIRSYAQRADIARCKSGSNGTVRKTEPSRGGNQCVNQCLVRQ